MIVERLTSLLGFEVDQQQLDAADRVIAGVEKKLARLALVVAPAAIGAAIGAVIKGTSERADASIKRARAIGIEAESYQELVFASRQAGIEQEQLDAVLPKLAAKTRQAATGNKELAKLYRSIGVSASELADLKPDEQFERIADGISKIDDAGKRNDALLKLFEEVGPRFASLFANGGAGIQALREQARTLGFVISEADAQRFERINDAISRISLIREGIQNAFSVEVSGELEGLVAELSEFLTEEGPSLRRVARDVAGFVGLLFAVFRSSLRDVREFTEGMGGAGNVLRLFGLALASILAAGLLFKFIGALKLMTGANLKLAASTLVANAPMLLVAAAIAFVLIALQDLAGWVNGNSDSVLGRVFGEFTPEGWADIETILKTILVLLVAFAALVGGPVLAVVLALVAAVTSLYLAWDDISEVAERGFDGILEDAELLLSDVAKPLVDAFSGAFDRIRDDFKLLTDDLASDFEEFFGRGFDGFVEDVQLLASTPGGGETFLGELVGGGAVSPSVDIERRALERQNARPVVNSRIEQVNVDARGMGPDEAREAVASGIDDAEKRKAARAFGGGT